MHQVVIERAVVKQRDDYIGHLKGRIGELEAVLAQFRLERGECEVPGHQGNDRSWGYPATAARPDGKKTWTGFACGTCFEREAQGAWKWSRPLVQVTPA